MNEQTKKNKKQSSFAKFWHGDISIIKKHLGLIALVIVLAIFYVSNRYTVQKQQIEIAKLKRELTQLQYLNLARSSELMEMTRESKIEEYVQKNKSDLQTLSEPPYKITYKKKK